MGEQAYPFEMFPGFIAHRRDIRFDPSAQAVLIRPLIDQLDFIEDKRHWAYAFRYGHVEITRRDFERIAHRMLSSGGLHGMPDNGGSARQAHATSRHQGQARRDDALVSPT